MLLVKLKEKEKKIVKEEEDREAIGIVEPFSLRSDVFCAMSASSSLSSLLILIAISLETGFLGTAFRYMSVNMLLTT